MQGEADAESHPNIQPGGMKGADAESHPEMQPGEMKGGKSGFAAVRRRARVRRRLRRALSWRRTWAGATWPPASRACACRRSVFIVCPPSQQWSTKDFRFISNQRVHRPEFHNCQIYEPDETTFKDQNGKINGHVLGCFSKQNVHCI